MLSRLYPSFLKEEEAMLSGLLWTVVVIFAVLWLLGFFVFQVGGGLIHLLLVIAVIVLVYNLFMLVAGRRSRG